MKCSISLISYSPVKSLSFQSVKSCNIIKNLGIMNDRLFAFSRSVDLKEAKLIENNPHKRKLNNFLTLKNSAFLNKYNFSYKEGQLSLKLNNKELISIFANDLDQRVMLTKKLMKLEISLNQPIFLLKNLEFPFFDTTHSNNVFNSMSLININSVKSFEKKIGEKIELQRFRGNFYIDGIDAWEERTWIGRVIKINNISFRVKKNIPRCVAINLKPETDDNSVNLLKSLKASYNHFDMGIYLMALEDGKINIGNSVIS